MLTLLSSVTALLCAVIAWTFITFRTETRASNHEMRGELQKINIRVAVIEALGKDRNETQELIRGLLEKAISD